MSQLKSASCTARAFGWQVSSVYQAYDEVYIVQRVSQTGLHGQSDFQAAVDAAKVVVCKAQGQHVVVDFLAERIGQTGGPSHGQVVPLYMAGGYVLPVGITRDLALACAVALWAGCSGVPVPVKDRTA